jgi:hypothetical protein
MSTRKSLSGLNEEPIHQANLLLEAASVGGLFHCEVTLQPTS